MLVAWVASNSGLQAQVTSNTCAITFEATWSEATHPLGFPPGPHFSQLIGGTHSAAVHFWRAGEVSSDGMESMAENGGTSLLANEVRDAISDGLADSVVLGGAVHVSPGSVSHQVVIDSAFPLLTLVTMIAPSPDWFVGVDSLPLFDERGWLSPTVDLVAWDAGTDSGPNYTSSNQDTFPPGVVTQLSTGPFAGTPPLGRFRISCPFFRGAFESGDLSDWNAVRAGS